MMTHDEPPFDEALLEIPRFEAEDDFVPDWAYDAALELPPFAASLPSSEARQAPQPDDASWVWQDARLVGLVREGSGGVDGPQYEIGCLQRYAHLHTGEPGGEYLAVARFRDEGVAEACFHDLQAQFHEGDVTPTALPGFAEQIATRMGVNPAWHPASPDEFAAYDYAQKLLAAAPEDDCPLIAFNPAPAMPSLDASEVAQALDAIGVAADGLGIQRDPPPFYDDQTGTAYWIGIFQPDCAERDACITSILSLGRHPETGALEAQLAPCVPGDWDKTCAAADYLIQLAQTGGMARCFEAAEAMALATDQRHLWAAERGVALDHSATGELAQYAGETWELK